MPEEKNQQKKEETEERKKEAQALLQELDKVRAEEQKGHEEKCKEIESRLRDLLQVSEDSWTAKDKTLDELIQKMETRFTEKHSINLKENKTDSMVLQTCSGGLALQGIYLTKSIDDQLCEDMQCLLKVPSEVMLTGEVRDDTLKEQFSSSHTENNFIKSVKILGRSITSAATLPVYGSVLINPSVSASTKSEKETTSKQSVQEKYSSTVQMSIVHVASYTFKKSSLELSEGACIELKTILRIVDAHGESSPEACEQCKRFFELFGSHISLGPLTFGGYMLWTCSSMGFQESQRETIKTMQKNAISTKVGVSFAGFGFSTEVNFDDFKGTFNGSDIENIVARSRLEMKINGGFESTDFAQWKKGLVENNSTWVLTNRGKRLVAVWEIIRSSHNTEFGKLVNVLRTSWEKITGLEAEKDLLNLAYNSEEILDGIKLWNNEGEKLIPEQILDQLKRLLKVKKDIIKKTGRSKYWITEYLANTTLQDFFLSLLELEADIYTQEEIKFVMTELVEEEELKKLDTVAFHGITKFTKWLYPTERLKPRTEEEEEGNVVDFSSFIEFLNKKIAVITRPDSKVPPHESIARYVEMGIRQLRLNYFKMYEDILISILTFPFQSGDSDSVIRLKPLSPVDLEKLQKSFSTRKEEFDKVKGNDLHLQCYLLLLAMKHSHATFFKSMMRVVVRLMKCIEPPVEEQLLLDLKKHAHHASLVSKFKPVLESLMESPQSVYTKQTSLASTENSLSLRNILEQITSYQFQPDSGEPFSQWDDNPEVHCLMDTMGLANFYPKKLGLKDALCINEVTLKLSLSGSSSTDPKQLPFLVLHQLMSYDSGSLSNIVPSVHESTEEEDDDDDYEDSDDDDDETGNPSSNFANKALTEIHPIDCLLTLLICCDDFLCQDLFSRLAKCQRAIPFIIPDPFTKQLSLPLWAMFSIIQEWKSTKGKRPVEQSHHIVNYPMPIISFLRFGTNHDRISKSKILNDVISESESPHNYFFHRDCPGGQFKRILGDGLVDMSWYLPTGRETDLFSDAITFLNLHGDARLHPKQTSFLSQVSSMCFILITEEDLEYTSTTMESLGKFNTSPGGIVILKAVAQKPKSLKKAFPESTVVDLIKRNSASEIKKVVRQKAKLKLDNLEVVKSIETCVKGTKFVSIDDESGLYKDGQNHACKLMDVIGSHSDKNTIKQALLPLQGETMWCAWAFYDKEVHRQIERGKETVNEYICSTEDVKDSIRSDQLKHIDCLTPLTALFIKTLLSLGGPSNRILRNYFLQCLKLNLNTLSRETMSTLQNQYQSIRKSLSLLQSDSENPEMVEKKMESLKKKLEVVQEEIINSSFGLEHFFRELGQVYEAALKSRQYGNELSCLPKAVAELLIDGYPLELMDGDAAHVPLEWVMAVLNETVNLLGDPNVFVLSVLGLQSTGKSTMLNTTFGVQFNVSAGRCTRGAYMQLLPLHEELKKETNCSYVLVVDTEGLRAPELDPDKTQKHDNELATFVIGLANTTLINIYGEVPGDMDDILQTSVHALLRMSQVRRHPSCQFVHQNAGMNTKSEIGRAKFTQKLNRFTQDAAREEHCEGQYTCFNDVIEFDDQTDVHYFPGLWKGDPPMAPVNQGYSRAAQQLKQHFIKIIRNRASKTDLSLSSFRVTVSDFWNALLREKFVFSFKNTLEITAYNSLETAYSKWQWRLREAMLTWENKAENVIKTESAETVSKLVTSKIASLQEFMAKEFVPIETEMEEFFKGKQSEILIQWKAKFELRISSLRDQLKQHAEEHCNRLLTARNAITTFEKTRKRDAEEIKRKVQEHIEKIKKEQMVLRDSIKNGKLESHQLKKLLHRDLFTSEKLALYRKQDIITSDELKRIESIILQSGSKLTENSLKKILSAETLTSAQVESILKTRQSEKELKIEFEKIWFDWTKHLQAIAGDTVDVDKEVEYVLTAFAKARGYDSQLIGKIGIATLREWGLKIDFIPVTGVHFEKTGLKSFFKGLLHMKEPCPDVIVNMTQDILHGVHDYLEATAKKETDFKSTYVLELLNSVEERIGDYSRNMKEKFTFTFHYKLEMYLIVCGLAIPTFDLMAKIFQEKNDPLKYLETKEKGPLFIQFKNQYDQTEAEEAIADSLCAYLKGPIKIQVENKLGRKMVTKMRSSGPEFSSKIALKVKILRDLHDKGFDDYMSYVHNIRWYFENCLKQYTIAYCNEKSGDATRLQKTARELINELVEAVENLVTDTNETYALKWLVEFSNDETFRSEVGVSLEPKDILCGYDESQVLDLDNFKLKIKQRLQKLREKLHSYYNTIKCNKNTMWKEKPHELLQDLVGCLEQCPFCSEQCDFMEGHIKDGQKHRVAVHRIQGINGCSLIGTDLLTPGLCPEKVASDTWYFRRNGKDTYYHNYQDVYPDWSIPRDASSKDCSYWKRFIAQYADSLTKRYGKKPEVSSNWSSLGRQEVEEDLRKIYKL